MEEEVKKDYYVVDLLHILRALWHRFWVIILSAVLAATAGLCLSAFVIDKKYSSSVMLYVNNSSISLGSDFSISTSQLTAAQGLAKTYTIILKNRTTLQMVLDEVGADTDTSYSYSDLNEMVEAASVDETEILKVTVTAKSAKDAQVLAQCIAKVLPKRISQVIDGATMEIVDDAYLNTSPISPNLLKFTIVGGVLGLVVAVIVLVIIALMDDTSHDEEFIQKNFNFPILAKIPDLLEAHHSGSSSYYYNGYYNDYQQPKVSENSIVVQTETNENTDLTEGR